MVGTAKLDDAQRKISFYRQPIRWYHFNKMIFEYCLNSATKLSWKIWISFFDVELCYPARP